MVSERSNYLVATLVDEHHVDQETAEILVDMLGEDVLEFIQSEQQQKEYLV